MYRVGVSVRVRIGDGHHGLTVMYRVGGGDVSCDV